MSGRIKNIRKANQLIDFAGLQLKEHIYPTDIDGLIEYNDSEYVLFEIKYKNSEVPKGQKLALERMVNDFRKLGKEAIAIVCEHDTKDPEKPVIAADCRVREVLTSGSEWNKPDSVMSLKDAIQMFQDKIDNSEVTIS
jgi:hypothetical protein